SPQATAEHQAVLCIPIDKGTHTHTQKLTHTVYTQSHISHAVFSLYFTHTHTHTHTHRKMKNGNHQKRESGVSLTIISCTDQQRFTHTHTHTHTHREKLYSPTACHTLTHTHTHTHIHTYTHTYTHTDAHTHTHTH